ncbi:MAG: SMC-Scp complex subunit ScpB [Thaumarchaeota archaeon]|nr:SMC-Scp complex subunit ScpB [Nitrososphaerota archaeon]
MGKVEDDEAIARLEAALYSAGRPLSIEELIKASGTESRTKTLALMTGIVKKTKSAFRALEIAPLPDGSYVFQLKPEYSTVIRKYASKPLLPTATLKTLSYIAYMQPVSSKRLVEVRGSGVYMHLKLLEQLAYIEHQNVGRLKIYNTTEKFQKYFGIQGDKDLLKQKLFTKVRSSGQSSASQPAPPQPEPTTETISQSPQQ